MSPEAEHRRPGQLAEAGPPEPQPASVPHHEHHVLREPGHDRWTWRARIRQNPHQLRVYRVVVAVLGGLLIGLGLATGWLPGPGGIPLVLAGLAVWASEFVWAERLMAVFKRQLARFRSWSRRQQTLAWVVFFACCGLVGYGYLLLLGAPSWVPADADAVLARLPGL
ncbi:PGPGW domain-containing protein [uncultured Friedmanniella sp.]|uniref:PGPGW domain-containing protein n=1 Tax=uncultured Friedmanniella sp. TaxID=335381 RepID=UPI0035CBFDDF